MALHDIDALGRGVLASRRTALGCALCLGVVAVVGATLQAGRAIAVVYPDVGEPYRAMFAKIIEGIDEQTQRRVPSFAVGATPNVQEIMGELRRQDIRVVIALGRSGIQFASGLESGIDVVSGGVLSYPEAEARNIAVQSLAPDPGLLFTRLQIFMPTVKRVFVVSDPSQNAWLMRLAKEAARVRGLELVSYEASDLKTALRFYQDILTNADARKDALWLPQDSKTVEDTTVLPLVLQESWTRNLVFFSSSASHVRRGALFSLYPNHIEIGRHLGGLALASPSAGNPTVRGILPLKAVQLAVNLRTANHLGINLAAREHFDLVYPEQ